MRRLRIRSRVHLLHAVCVAVWVLGPACAERAPAPDLAGVWQERDDRGTLVSLWSFEGDGRFTYDHLPEPAAEDAEHLRGTFRIVMDDGAELAIDAVDVGARQRLRSQVSFHASGDFFAPEAFLPVDAHSDLVGAWRQRSLRQTLDASGQINWQDRRTQTLELGPAGELRLVQIIDDSPPAEERGHYEALGDHRYRMTIELAHVSLSFTLHLLNGEALAPRIYRRSQKSAPTQ